MGLIDDVVKSGGNLDRLLNTFSKKFKKAQKIAQDAIQLRMMYGEYLILQDTLISCLKIIAMLLMQVL